MASPTWRTLPIQTSGWSSCKASLQRTHQNALEYIHHQTSFPYDQHLIHRLCPNVTPDLDFFSFLKATLNEIGFSLRWICSNWMVLVNQSCPAALWMVSAPLHKQIEVWPDNDKTKSFTTWCFQLGSPWPSFHWQVVWSSPWSCCRVRLKAHWTLSHSFEAASV